MDARIKAIEFIEDKHEYWFTDEQGRHRRLYGVTASIGELMGKSFPDIAIVKLATIYGHDVHKEVELWVKEGKEPSSEAGKWLVQFLQELKSKYSVSHFDAELLVSDFDSTASCIDVVAHLSDNRAILFDLKTISHFDRAYCSLQLSCYKKLYEENYKEKVVSMFVLGTTSRRAFRILPQDGLRVQKVFDMNKAKVNYH